MRWRKLVLGGDALVIAVLMLLALPLSSLLGLRDGWRLGLPGWWQGSAADIITLLVGMAVVLGAYVWLHFRVRNIAAGRIQKQIEKQYAPGLERDRMTNAFMNNTG